MLKNIVFWAVVLITLIGWPVSLITNLPKFETGFIWQMNDAGEEKRILLQKLGMSASLLKRVFYNNKTTIVLDRYTKNILTMVDSETYFFGDQKKFFSVTIIAFLVGVYISIKKKKYLKLWLYGLGAILLVSFFKNMNGWDLALYPVIAVTAYAGLKEIFKYFE